MRPCIHLRTLAHVSVFCLAACWPLVVSADLLNRIEVHKENNVGVIHIILTRPVIYTHHFPPEKGYLVHIYFNDPSLDRSNWGASVHGPGRLNDEFMRSPPNDIVPIFWVAYQNHGTNDQILDPHHLVLQFAQPVHYKVVPDSENQGFYIFVLSTDAPPAKNPPKDADKEQTKTLTLPLPAKPEPSVTPEPPATN